MAYRSHTGEAFAIATGVTWTCAALPTGWQAGDICLAFVSSAGSAVTISGHPAGWTLLHGPTVSTGGDENGYCYWRLLQPGDTPPAFTWGSATIGNVMLVCYSGRDTVAPVEASAATSFGAVSSVVVPSITTTTDLCDVVCFVADDASSANANYFTAFTGGFTERGEWQSATGDQQTQVIADVVRTPAGSGGVTVTKAASDQSISFLIALKPGAPAGAAFIPKVISYA